MIWNPWQGCHKYSEGCQNCYLFLKNQQRETDSTVIQQSRSFQLPMMRNKQRIYRMTANDNPIYVCMASDFFIEEADSWRSAVWDIMHYRKDLEFKIITKRIHRFEECKPKNWGRGYPNVTLICNCENQRAADERLPVLVDILAAHKEIIHEPMLERIDIEKYLASGCIDSVTCSGESGEGARICDYAWVMDTREQCIRNRTAFMFKQTGSCFQKDGKLYPIERKMQTKQAKKAEIDYYPEQKKEDNNSFDRILFQLSKTKYHSAYKLTPMMKEYCRQKGYIWLREQAFEIVRKNIKAPHYSGEGRQTPIDGNPIYIAQHATATCCRRCLSNWHSIVSNRRLRENDIIYIVDLIMEWIKRQLEEK